MKRSCTLVLAMVVACTARAEGVTVTSSGAPLKTVLAQVSQQTGLALDAGALKDLPLIVKVKDMTTKTFLDRLAQVVDADWNRVGSTFTLVRGPSHIKAAEAVEIDRRSQWVQEGIAKYLKDQAAAEDWSDAALDKRLKEDAQRRQGILDSMQGGQEGAQIMIRDSQAVSAASMILHEALRKFPARTLAAIGADQRVVFSNQPTRMQKQLPYVPATLDAFVRVFNRIVGANKATGNPTGSAVKFDTPMSKAEFIQGIAKLLVIADRVGDALQISVKVVGLQGQILDEGQAFLGSPRPGAGTAPADATGDILVSPTSKGLIQAFQTNEDGGNQFQFAIRLDNSFGTLSNTPPAKPLTPEVAKILADPVTNEPLSFFVAESLLQLADARKKNMIACVPDTTLGTFAIRLNGGKSTVADLYKSAPSLGILIDEQDGVLLITPESRAAADRTRVNRTEFGRLVASLAKGYATLDEVARYALAMPAWNDRNLDALWLNAYSPATSARYDANQNVYLKLYGSLTPSQKLVNSRRSIILGMQMSQQQRALLEAIVYQPGGPRILGNGSMMMTATETTRRGGAPPAPPEPEVIRVEPTEAFPNGLPPNTRCTLDRRWFDGVFAVDDAGQGRFLSAADLGLRMGFDPTKLPGMRVQNKFGKYFLSDLTTITVALQFGQRSRSADLQDASIRTNAAAMTFDQLPTNFLADVERARQQAANMRTMQFGGSTGTKPPPSPL